MADNPACLVAMPPEILLNISCFLNQRERSSFALTCKAIARPIHADMYLRDKVHDDSHALLFACRFNRTDILRAVIKEARKNVAAVINQHFQELHYVKGPDVFGVDLTPLSVAIRAGSCSVALKLLRKGARHDVADLNPRDRHGQRWSPIHWAAAGTKGPVTKQLIRILARNGADLNARPLDPFPDPDATEDDEEDTVDLQHLRNHRAGGDWAPIYTTLDLTHPRIRLADRPEMKPKNYTLHYQGVLAHRRETLRALLKYGADPNARLHERTCETPVFYMINNFIAWRVDFCYYLRSYEQEEKPLQARMVARHVMECLELLKNAGANMNLTYCKLRSSYTPTVSPRPENSGCPTCDGLCPIQRAAVLDRESETIMEWLLMQGNADLAYCDLNKQTPLFYLCRFPSKASVELCHTYLIKGADPDHKDSDGRTVLHYLAEKRFDGSCGDREKMARILVSNGANPTIKDKQGKMPADLLEEGDGFKKSILTAPRRGGQANRGRGGGQSDRGRGRGGRAGQSANQTTLVHRPRNR
ncbi:ankyrin repeat-containing domain protein [Xylariomycetidae sp. FL0641]|nr:ankyrin repeat-containing domain protein [Xylariomycetidae sp. FL0641]